MGFFYRTIRIVENGIKPAYVFDGKPPELKSGVVRVEYLESQHYFHQPISDASNATFLDRSWQNALKSEQRLKKMERKLRRLVRTTRLSTLPFRV
jgi:flap endonuclease-1